jgi:hypothetical protein
MELLRSQREWLFNAIAGSGFNAREFTLEPDPLGRPTVTHRPSAYWFRIMVEPAGHTVSFSPASDRLEGSYGRGIWDSIVPAQFKLWLSYVRRELEASDPWAQLALQREAVAGDLNAVENTPFSAEELRVVARQIEEGRAYARALNLPPEQLAAVEARLDYVAGAAERGMGRIDWRNAFVGVMLTLLVESAAPPEAVRTILTMTLRGLGHLFGIDLPGLPS